MKKANEELPAEQENERVRFMRLGNNGRMDFEWAVAWGVVKAQLILIPLIFILLFIFVTCAGLTAANAETVDCESAESKTAVRVINSIMERTSKQTKCHCFESNWDEHCPSLGKGILPLVFDKGGFTAPPHERACVGEELWQNLNNEGRKDLTKAIVAYRLCDESYAFSPLTQELRIRPLGGIEYWASYTSGTGIWLCDGVDCNVNVLTGERKAPPPAPQRQTKQPGNSAELY